MMFHTEPDRVDCELAWSPDTIQWRRIQPGTALIPVAEEKGAYDWGCVYAAAYPIILENEIRLFYGASDDTHYGRRKGYLALATLRPDGFAGYEPIVEGPCGTVRTKPLLCTGSQLLVTTDAAGGSVCVTAMDPRGKRIAECEPITGNVTDHPVSWKDGAGLAPSCGTPIRLEFVLESARLYSFRFAKGAPPEREI
jgi:hypothetical protein